MQACAGYLAELGRVKHCADGLADLLLFPRGLQPGGKPREESRYRTAPPPCC